MNTSFSSSRILILGAYGGIGSALVHRLAGQGARIVAAGRDPQRLEPLCQDTGAHPLTVETTSSTSMEAAIAHTVEHLGGLDGIALCVGSMLLKPAHLTSDDEWHATLTTNLTSAFLTIKYGAKAIGASGGGSIVLISTVAARLGLANHEAIAAAKAGIEGLARSAAATYASRNVRINCIAPGLVQTPLSVKITSNEAALNASKAMHPLGRIGQPDDIAASLEWLLNPAQRWITGQIIGIDGGLSTVRSRSTG
ncbi:MAG TPA: SDR family oxidoreductase [Kiritimatiellia bacterium]|nr:SDR family oxidoreductase [Kiritimatiellia bacterium]